MRRFLITGASGFVGQQVALSLRRKNIPLTLVLRRRSVGNLHPALADEQLVFTEDLFQENESWWSDVGDHIDTVVHAAWYVGYADYLDSPKNMDCLSGSLVMARGLARAGIRRFVGVGTCFEYDLREGVLSVDTLLKPSSFYGVSKVALFSMLTSLFKAESIEFVWCRLFYLFGEGEDERRLGAYVRKQLTAGKEAYLSDGGQVRDFMDVRDAGVELAEVGLSDLVGPQNICSGRPQTIRQFVEGIADSICPDKKHLLKFGAQTNRNDDPECVLGIKSFNRGVNLV